MKGFENPPAALRAIPPGGQHLRPGEAGSAVFLATGHLGQRSGLAPVDVPSRPALDAMKARTPKPGEASFFYRDHHFQHDAVKVLPGEYFVTTDDMMVMTVLGSCIAACIWDPQVRVGGMNHFMLPEGAGDTSGRYGSYAMELLINEMMKLGARRERMQAKVFGGGQVMHTFTTLNVGERNTRFVMDYLQTERIAIISKDVLDIHPRKVCYFPATGKAMCKRLAHSHPETLDNQARLGSSGGGSVDLF